MKNSYILTALIILLSSLTFAEDYPEIHCKHFFYGYPKGAPKSNDMIIRDDYALSSNDTTKFADWVCYRLDNDTITGNVKTERKWKADPWLSENETLEPPDYKDVGKLLKSDRGHQAPLASFKGTKSWYETNYLSNITPQKSDLNQGGWLKLENKERELVRHGKVIYVITGPLYEHEMPALPNADEPHKVPSGYWKIIFVPENEYAKPTPSNIKIYAYIFDQNTPRNAYLNDFPCSVDEIEKRAGLDFMSDLEDSVEAKVEREVYK